MSERSAMFLVVVGLILTMLGVGGVENSITDGELLGSVVVSITGLALMYCAVAALKVSDYYDRG